MFLEWSWTIVLTASCLYAIRNLTLSVKDVNALSHAIERGEALFKGPRWWWGIGQVIGNTIFALFLGVYAAVGAVAIAQDLIGETSLLVARMLQWGLYGGGLLIATLPVLASFIRKRTMAAEPEPIIEREC